MRLININLYWLIDHNWYNWLIYCLILIDCVILIDWYDCVTLIDWEIAWYWMNERLLDFDWFSDCVMLIDWLRDCLIFKGCVIFKDWLWSRCLQWYGRTVPLPVWLESSADSETRLAPEIICSFGFYTMKTGSSSATCPGLCGIKWICPDFFKGSVLFLFLLFQLLVEKQNSFYH